MSRPRHCYRVYGLAVAVDRSIPGLSEIVPPGAVDASICFASIPRDLPPWVAQLGDPTYVSRDRGRQGRPASIIWEDVPNRRLRVELHDDMRFVIDEPSGTIWVDDEIVGENAAIEYVLGPVLGLLLRRRGVVCLHASIVEADGQAIAFAGPQGSGKSTLAACFALRGWPVRTDDLAALRDTSSGVLVEMGSTILRARPGMLERDAARFGRLQDLTPVPRTPYLDFPANPNVNQRGDSALPLGAIYFLDRVPGDTRISAMRGLDAVMALVADTWIAPRLDRAQRAAELDLLSRLVAQVPMRRLLLRHDEGDVSSLVTLIAADIARVTSLMEPVQ